MMLPSSRRRALSRALIALFATLIALPLTTGSAHAAPANDDFADAESITSLPANRLADLASASAESGEGDPGCGSYPGDPTVWYTFTTATQLFVSLEVDDWSAQV